MPTVRRLATPPVLLGALAAASAALLLAWQSHLTFLIDDWDLLLNRRGFNAHAFLDPHNEHIIIAPTAIYKAIQATIGMDSLLPYAVVATAAFIASAVLLFVYLRSRIGDWLALAGATLVLFIGAAYEDLLTPFQVGYFGSMAFGLGALLALDRSNRAGDAWACVLLVLSLTFSEVGHSLHHRGRRGDRARPQPLATGVRGGGAARALRDLVPRLGTHRDQPSLVPQRRQQSGLRARRVRLQHRLAAGAVDSADSRAAPAGSGGDGHCSSASWRSPPSGSGSSVVSRRRSWVPLTIGLSFWFLTAANTGSGDRRRRRGTNTSVRYSSC